MKLNILALNFFLAHVWMIMEIRWRKSMKFSFPCSNVRAKSQQNVCHVSSAVFLNIPSCWPRFSLATTKAIVLPKKMDNCCNIKTSRPENIDFCFSLRTCQCPCHAFLSEISPLMFSRSCPVCVGQEMCYLLISSRKGRFEVRQETTRFSFHVFAW